MSGVAVQGKRVSISVCRGLSEVLSLCEEKLILAQRLYCSESFKQ